MSMYGASHGQGARFTYRSYVRISHDVTQMKIPCVLFERGIEKFLITVVHFNLFHTPPRVLSSHCQPLRDRVTNTLYLEFGV